MKARVIKKDFAKRASFLKNDAKNAVEKNRNTALFREIDKKCSKPKSQLQKFKYKNSCC